MKNQRLRTMALLIVNCSLLIAFTACDDGSKNDDGIYTVGSLTVTGISPEYNGKWGYGATMGAGERIFLTAANCSPNGTVTFGKITNGSVSLKVWELVNNSSSLINYNGNDTFEFVIVIVNIASSSLGTAMDDTLTAVGSVTVTFTNGRGSGSFVKLFS